MLLPAARTGNINCLLRRGDRSAGVEQLQISLGSCYKAKLVRDGVFGPRTQAALRKAQSQAGTAADGVYGPATRRAIKHHVLGDSPCGRSR
jgi:peptidoglycan hydrolase-like protein with peptidoglycan-binding domain